jgi:hypothetical protein
VQESLHDVHTALDLGALKFSTRIVLPWLTKLTS